MVKFILLAIVVIAIVLVIAYFTGKHKSHSEKSSTEKLASTLHTRFEKLINDLNNSVRTPEIIQDEMLNAIDEYKLEKLKEIEHTVENLITTKNKLLSNRNNMSSIQYKLENRLREIRKEWIENKENEELANSGADILRQIDDLKNTIKEIDSSIEGIKEQINEIEKATTTFNTKIETKRCEVLTIISKYIASDYSTSVKFNLNIDDLVVDYKNTIEVRQEKAKITNIINNGGDINETPVASKEYIDKFKNL